MKAKKWNGSKVPLKNKGELSLFFIGIGSAFSKTLFQNNLLVVQGNHHVVIDCGTRFSQAIEPLKLSIKDFKTFLITHSHADHIGGLEEVSLQNRYFFQKKPSIIVTESYQNILWDMSLKGGLAFSEEAAGTPLGLGDYWDIIRPQWVPNMPREVWETNLGKLNLKLVRTKHFPEKADSWQSAQWSCGIIFNNRVLFTGDTRFDPDLLASLDRLFHFETIFHDCQFFTGGVHASMEEMKTLPKAIKARMVLMHYGDNWEEYKEKAEEYGFSGFGQQQQFYIFE